jgi:hypothetical protein
LQTLYHVDTLGRLAAGMTIDLHPRKPSRFGDIYRHQFAKAGVLDALTAGVEHKNLMLLSNAAYREYYLELFRTHHPQISKIAPTSRLSSFFTVKTVSDAWRYVERHEFKGKPTIFAIHCDGPLTQLDMTWLDQQFPRDISAFSYYYEHYWNGSHISNDQHLASHEARGSFIEVLVSTPVTIGQPVIAEANGGAV